MTVLRNHWMVLPTPFCRHPVAEASDQPSATTSLYAPAGCRAGGADCRALPEAKEALEGITDKTRGARR
jgi:hypothetical protein